MTATVRFLWRNSRTDKRSRTQAKQGNLTMTPFLLPKISRYLGLVMNVFHTARVGSSGNQNVMPAALGGTPGAIIW